MEEGEQMIPSPDRDRRSPMRRLEVAPLLVGANDNCVTTATTASNKSSGGSGTIKGMGRARNKIMDAFDNLPARAQLVLLIAAVFISFIAHNSLQEHIMLAGFQYGWVLGLFEVMGVLLGTSVERHISHETKGRTQPLASYLGVGCCLFFSSSLSNVALNYINFPTKVVFRSCKLIPTMALSRMWNKNPISGMDFLCATLLCLGLIIFGTADVSVSPNFDPRGIILVLGSVCADSILPNLQERLFENGAGRSEVTYYSNIFSIVAMLLVLWVIGDLGGAVVFAMANPHVRNLMVLYAVVAYFAVFCYMNLIFRFGGVTAVLVGNTRKAATVMLSFVLFPKPFTYNYVSGGLLVVAGLFGHIRVQQKEPLNGRTGSKGSSRRRVELRERERERD